MAILLQDKSHFLHQAKAEASPHKVPLVEQKRALLKQLETRPDQGGHSWQSYRSGVRCDHCKQRFHAKSLVADLREALDSTCDMAAPVSQPKKTRFQVIEELIAAQSGVQPGVHHLKLDKAYLRCSECAGYSLARCNEEIFTNFVSGACMVGPLDPSLWRGHPSHTMSRKGSVARCTRCGGSGRIKRTEVELNEKLRRRCEHLGSKDLRSWFT